MLIGMRVFDENQQETVHFQPEINAEAMISIAKERETWVREKGRSFTQGAVPFFGGAFIKAVRADDEREINKSAIEAAMSAWLYDHVYGGISEAEFLRSQLEFNLHPTGMVVYNRRVVR